jgi:hypothetical protein
MLHIPTYLGLKGESFFQTYEFVVVDLYVNLP